jgi:hypothetical protein
MRPRLDEITSAEGQQSCVVYGQPNVNAAPRAFSSELDTGSRQENASNKEPRAPFRIHRNGKGSSLNRLIMD